MEKNPILFVDRLQVRSDFQTSAAVLVGTYLNKTSNQYVLTLDKPVKSAFKNFINSGIICPVGVQGEEERYIVPLDNTTANEEDIKELRKVLLNIIETEFPPEEIPPPPKCYNIHVCASVCLSVCLPACNSSASLRTLQECNG